MDITLNGEQREVESAMTLGQLVAALELHPRQVAVEVNLKLVPRAEHSAHQLQEGDQVEIVTLVGGG